MYGEKNVKWVTGIEVVTYDAQGFYERQGWGPNFVIPIRSRFYEPDLSQPITSGTAVNLRGIVYGGTQGISRAEVSTDEGRTWHEAEIECMPNSGVVRPRDFPRYRYAPGIGLPVSALALAPQPLATPTTA